MTIRKPFIVSLSTRKTDLIGWLLFLLAWSLVEGQHQPGCQGTLEFTSTAISSFRANWIIFHDESTASNEVDCAGMCYRAELCRLAVFDQNERSCKHSYFNGRCNQEVQADELFGGFLIQLSCIVCRNSHQEVTKQTTMTSTVAVELPSRHRLVPKLGTSTSTGPILRKEEGPASRIFQRQRKRYRDEIRRPTFAEIDSWRRTCYRRYQGSVLLGGVMDIQSGVTLQECQCMCAERRRQRLQQFGCKGVTYNHHTSECVLKDQSPLNSSHPMIKLRHYIPVTYYEFICERSEYERSEYVLSVCESPSQTVVPSLLPPRQRASDTCYKEVKEYLMKGSAVSITTNVSLKKCKCNCAETHSYRYSRYRCMSITYYYDSNMCIMNRDNMDQSPDKLQPEITEYVVTYYGYSCSNSYDRTEEYLNGHCRGHSDNNQHNINIGRLL